MPHHFETYIFAGFHLVFFLCSAICTVQFLCVRGCSAVTLSVTVAGTDAEGLSCGIQAPPGSGRCHTTQIPGTLGLQLTGPVDCPGEVIWHEVLVMVLFWPLILEQKMTPTCMLSLLSSLPVFTLPRL